MASPSPFSICRCAARRTARKLRRRLRRLSRLAPDKVPILILGRKRKRQVVVMHPDDAVFLRRDATP